MILPRIDSAWFSAQTPRLSFLELRAWSKEDGKDRYRIVLHAADHGGIYEQFG